MSPYLKITLGTFTIWIVSSLMNGVLLINYRILADHIYVEPPESTFFNFFISFVVFAPGFFIFWIILLVKVSDGIYGRALFRAALSTAFILAAGFGLMISLAMKPQVLTNIYVFIVFPMVSSTTGIMMHFGYFKKINN